MTTIDREYRTFILAGASRWKSTVTRCNLEAAEEVVTSAAFCDIGGMVMSDFVDMVMPANR